MKRNKTARNFIFRIDIPALFAFILFAGLIFLYLIPGFEKAMMDRKREMIHEISSSVYTLLEYYSSREKEGTIGSQAAKDQASEAIRSIRYGEELKDYFWITDTFPRMIVHPYRSDLDGQDLRDFRDAKGKRVFVDFVSSVKPEGESYVNYMWQWNDDSTRVVPKLSYVRLFEPWGWVIGTGIYTEDVRTQIRKIELGALIISVTIGALIIILLTIISFQSHKIEAKRSRAEEELHKSRELYKALAEAASEGVIIWSSNGMQGNKTLLSWLGYTEAELQKLTFTDISDISEFGGFTNPGLLYDELSTRQYADATLKTKEGSIIRTYADLSRIEMGSTRAVMIVLRPSRTFASVDEFSTAAALLDGIKTGFFRTTFGKKNRFLHATSPLADMLGFSSLQELLRTNINSCFADSVQARSFSSAISSREPFMGKEILFRRKNGASFWALVNATVIESSSGELWCEGTIEPLDAHDFRSNTLIADTGIYSSSFIMQAPIKPFIKKAIAAPENLTCVKALALLKEKNDEFIVVTDKNGEPVGVADAGTLGLSIAQMGRSETEIFRVMVYPVIPVSINTKVNEALSIINDTGSKCLIVGSEKNKIEGLITSAELIKAFSTAPELIIAEIGNASTSAELHNIFMKSRMLAVSMILGHADPLSVTRFISSIGDLICQRVIAICLEKSEDPPCLFAFIQTGSAGRMEQTLCTDQDNAIIFEKRKDEEELKSTESYFLDLAWKINTMLSEAGYKLCKGENMASNPKWCQPIDKWKKYFSDWIRMPGPEELLEISIFFDFRHCYGESALTTELREYVNGDLAKNDIFFHHMAAGWKEFSRGTHFVSDGVNDIKKLTMPLTGIIRLYALKYTSGTIPTIERIMNLYRGGHIDKNILRDTIMAWKDMTSVRLIHQAEWINNGSEPDNNIDFGIDAGNLRYFADRSVAAITNLMLRADTDFYTSSI